MNCVHMFLHLCACLFQFLCLQILLDESIDCSETLHVFLHVVLDFNSSIFDGAKALWT